MFIAIQNFHHLMGGKVTYLVFSVFWITLLSSGVLCFLLDKHSNFSERTHNSHVVAREQELHPETGNNIHLHNTATLTLYKTRKLKSRSFTANIFPEIGSQIWQAIV